MERDTIPIPIVAFETSRVSISGHMKFSHPVDTPKSQVAQQSDKYTLQTKSFEIWERLPRIL